MGRLSSGLEIIRNRISELEDKSVYYIHWKTERNWHEEAEAEKEEKEGEGEKESINITYHINKLKKKNCMILLVDTEKTFDKI